ncbi:hypothetical protein BSP239C_02097 [Brevibacterium sp. 239c]|nr:hypothetical protein BSP239C_02097 [Brevibacterium sp. 239c]
MAPRWAKSVRNWPNGANAAGDQSGRLIRWLFAQLTIRTADHQISWLPDQLGRAAKPMPAQMMAPTSAAMIPKFHVMVMVRSPRGFANSSSQRPE